MPNLENLKKQAKRYVRWRREGKHTVAAVIRETLPRFAGMSDAAIMAQPFRLADAQELVARQNGYPTWQALIKGSEAMSSTPQPYPSRPILTNVEPQIFVADMARALDFYREKLGFKVGFTYGEPPFYAQVVRDAAMANLRWVKEPVLDRSRERDLLSAAFSVSHAKLLFQELQEAGVSFHQSLTREPWHSAGHGSFIVADPDGNLLLFGGRTD